MISNVAGSNAINRKDTKHCGFTFLFLVASGHIKGGKMRMGNETPRFVDAMCSIMSRRSPELNFAKSVYLSIHLTDGRHIVQTNACVNVDAIVPALVLHRVFGHRLGPPTHGRSADTRCVATAANSSQLE